MIGNNYCVPRAGVGRWYRICGCISRRFRFVAGVCVGRIHSMYMFPMTFDEFLLANGKNLLMETRDQAYRLAGAVRQFDCDGFVR